MIKIRQSPTADTRICDFVNVSTETLLASSVQHIGDVWNALSFFRMKISEAMTAHDADKLTDIDGFHADFVTGFKQTGWWDRHRKLNRHHLQQADGIPADVNLIDVLDFIADCVMAGMARSGSVYELKLPAELLERAFQNTVALLKSQVVVESAIGEPGVLPVPRKHKYQSNGASRDPVCSECGEDLSDPRHDSRYVELPVPPRTTSPSQSLGWMDSEGPLTTVPAATTWECEVCGEPTARPMIRCPKHLQSGAPWTD